MTDYIGQKNPSKMCECGRARMLTGHASKYNSKVAGKQKCVECAMDEIYSKLKK